MRLNGWQRLWVVASVIWLVAPANVITGELQSTHNLLEDTTVPCPSRRIPFACAAHDPERTVEIDGVLHYFATEGEAVPNTWADLGPQTFALAFGVWIGPQLLLYGLGLIFVWVRRGFQGER